MKHPLVSVIIPTFNRAGMVCEAIDSVLEQRFLDYELIVVDDGSTDNTQVMLAIYGNRFTLALQDNRGVSAARNKGAGMARGTWLAFLDSDDLWLPEKLYRQVQYIAENPSCLLCQTQEIWIRNHERIYPKKKHRKPSGMIFEPSLQLCLVSPSAVMIKKLLFEKTGGFDETLPACEDYDLWLRISHRYPIHLVDDPLVIKRGGHNDQLSKTPNLDIYRIQSLYQLLTSGGLTHDQEASTIKVLKQKCLIYANGCRKRGRIDEALQYERLADSAVDAIASGVFKEMRI
jgi:glycosyltransferase involved in cell wall biosynthesis